MKKNNYVLLGVLFFYSHVLKTSEKSFFDESTKYILMTSAQFYATSSLLFYAVGKCLQGLSGVPLSFHQSLDLHVLYNDTFPKDYCPQSSFKKIIAYLSRGCLITGSVLSSPLRSTASMVYEPIESIGEEISRQKHLNIKSTSQFITHVASDMSNKFIRGSRFGVLGFAIPIAYHKYQQNKMLKLAPIHSS